MKKVLALMLICVMLLCCACGGGEKVSVEDLDLTGTYTKDLAGTTLNVFNWGEYISDGSEGSLDVNALFEELTGIKVNYTNYDSNEAMYGKMAGGAVAYDVIIPSDYMIARLISEDMLQPLDFSKIDNYGNIDPAYHNQYFDPENLYSVPYTVGMVGLIYNTELVEEAPTSWSAMWDERYADDILTFNNPRDAFAIAQFLLGISLNTEDLSEWDAAAAKLKEQAPLLQGRVMDEVFNKMEGGNAAMAPYYAGDFLTMYDTNDDLAFVYPSEGVNIFVDSMCVPANCQNYDAAMMYINFMLEKDIATAVAEYICYASPNLAVRNNPEYSLADEPVLYPDAAEMPHTEYFYDMKPEVRAYYEKLWEEILREFAN